MRQCSWRLAVEWVLPGEVVAFVAGAAAAAAAAAAVQHCSRRPSACLCAFWLRSIRVLLS